MKKLSILILSLFLLCITCTGINAQCPSGYTVKTDNVNICGCTYLITYCYICRVTAPSDIFIHSIVRKNNCTPTPGCNFSLVLKTIIDNILKTSNLNSLCGFPGPCPYGGSYYTIKIPFCWQKRCDTDLSIAFEECTAGTGYCYETYEICWDSSTNTFTKLFIGATPSGSNACSDIEPADPTVPGEVSTCFKYLLTKCP